LGESSIQLHGGMGVVDEYNVSHYFKRATMIGVLFGNVDYHMKRYTDLTQSNIDTFDKDSSISLS
jgi:alkylation response protein AidB-like acyl-CoA dehydrogenase